MSLIRIMYEAAVENYFNGWRPICLDDTQPLLPSIPRTIERLCRSALRDIGRNFRSSPGPEEMIASVLAM
jgi:hypothetical protein